MCCAQPRELEPADDVLESHLLERLSQGIVDGILVPRRDRAEVRLDLRPESLDRRVVRAVGRQGQEPGTRPPDGRRGGISLMGDRLSHTTTSPACSSGTSTCSTYDSNAAVSVDPGNASGARTPSSPNAAITVSDSHEPGAEPTARSPRRGPAVGPGHRRGHPRLVHENKPFRLDPLHLPPEGPPLLPDVGPVALVGVLGLLLGSQAAPAQGAPDRRQAAVEAALLPKLVQGVVVVIPDQILQAPLVVRAQDRGRAASVRLGGQRVLLTSPLQQPGDERDADSEEAGDLALRALALVHRRRDSLPQVHRIGTHGRYLLIRCRLLPRSCPSL